MNHFLIGMAQCLDIGAVIGEPFSGIKRKKRARSIEEVLKNDLTKIEKDFKMTHVPDVSESEGDFGPAEKELSICRKCGERTAECKPWESKCGGYEDWKYSCLDEKCGYSWWEEGIDS